MSKKFGVMILVSLLLIFAVQVFQIAPTITVNGFRYLHTLHEENTSDESTDCSSEAIGPHALFTAEHCLLTTDTVTIDSKQTCKIIEIKKDGHDHAILLVRGCSFSEWLPVHLKTPQVGDLVTLFGEALALEEGAQFRQGYMTGYGYDVDRGNSAIYELSCIPGDSGSFIMDGFSVVGAVSQAQHSFCFSYEFEFTNKDFREAAKFK